MFRMNQIKSNDKIGNPTFELTTTGFPSPSEDYKELGIDIGKYLIDNPQATFYVRAKGNEMEGACIKNNSILVVDRSKEPKDGSIAVCNINGELLIRRIKKTNDSIILVPEHPAYDVIKISKEHSFEIWGIVTFAINKM